MASREEWLAQSEQGATTARGGLRGNTEDGRVLGAEQVDADLARECLCGRRGRERGRAATQNQTRDPVRFDFICGGCCHPTHLPLSVVSCAVRAVG